MAQKINARATIKEIAKLASTSTATVSRVLSNDSYPVSDELRQRVISIANELNYTPNLIGRFLKSNTSNEVGVIVPTISNPFYSLLILGIEDVLAQNGYSMLLGNSFRDERKEKAQVELLAQKQVKGIIIASITKKHDYLHQFIDRGLKLVTFDQEVNDIDCTKIVIDYFKGSLLAMQHLFSKGHRHICFLSAPLTRGSRRLIYDGYIKSMRSQGIKVEKEWVVISDVEVEKADTIYEFENGKRLAEQLVKMKNRPTAILTINDMTAYGILSELGQRGISVPGDVSLVSFDNIFFS